MSYKAKIREDALKLNPIDDAMFIKMAEDLGFCEELLQVILGDKELKVLTNHHQHVVKNLQGRSCTLDLMCKLGTGHTVLVEVQKADDDDHQRRVRYESSVLTANITDPGTKFEKVPDVISVFISRFDVFDSGYATYHVDRVLRETGKVVDNGTMEIYVNAQIDDGTDIADLMKVFSQDAIYDDKFPKASDRKRIFKTTEEGVRQMCEIIERNRREAAAEAAEKARAEALVEGEAKGRLEGVLRTALSMIKKGRMTEDEAAEEAKMSLSDFRKAVAALS